MKTDGPETSLGLASETQDLESPGEKLRTQDHKGNSSAAPTLQHRKAGSSHKGTQYENRPLYGSKWDGHSGGRGHL